MFIRPPDVVKEDLIKCCCAFFLFYQTSNLPDCLAYTCQKYIGFGGWVLLIMLKCFVHPPNFYIGWKSKIWPGFSTYCRSSCETEQHIWNLLNKLTTEYWPIFSPKLVQFGPCKWEPSVSLGPLKEGRKCIESPVMLRPILLKFDTLVHRVSTELNDYR